MNKLHIIGNLTNDPELRTTTSGKSVCTFTVAVNRRKTQSNQNPETDYFRVSVWDKLGENCAKYLTKGKKVAVIGSVSVRTYDTNSGEHRASMEVQAGDVEFLSPRSDSVDQQSGMTKASPADNPFADDDRPY